MVEEGKRYLLTMKGEKEFGGPVRVTKVTTKTVEAIFSFLGDQEDPNDTLKFSRTGNFIRYKPDENDAFPNKLVKFGSSVYTEDHKK